METEKHPMVGGIYSYASGQKELKIIKVLAFDPPVVSLRFYKNKITSGNLTLNVSDLTVGKLGDTDGFSMGHLPVHIDSFMQWQLHFIMEMPVAEEELEGYRYWKETSGSYFGGPGYNLRL